ncbi:drs2 neo1 protein [Conoideocrella luteorostrata]|uniref:Drs2 neo1 protein n=1 Tax=Conoideocrella luteorostrata TaxID=1105319 RepID=A0AAJ0CAS5_9HYPO|nr:drs2 neo1 protein [Conoideocrella luteorostrata]
MAANEDGYTSAQSGANRPDEKLYAWALTPSRPQPATMTARDEDAAFERGVRAKNVALAETGDWLHAQWRNIKVGDVVWLKRNAGVPADITLLHATGLNGITYIKTIASDGETNLKSEQACPLLAERCNTLDGIILTQATVVSEDPTIDRHIFGAFGMNASTHRPALVPHVWNRRL